MSEDDVSAQLARLEQLDPERPDVVRDDDRADMRRIGVALYGVESAESRLVEAVAHARISGRSWTEIANVLGVSRQAARQRFANKVGADSGITPASVQKLVDAGFTQAELFELATWFGFAGVLKQAGEPVPLEGLSLTSEKSRALLEFISNQLPHLDLSKLNLRFVEHID